MPDVRSDGGIFGLAGRLAAIAVAAPIQTAAAGTREAARAAEDAADRVYRGMEAAWREARSYADQAAPPSGIPAWLTALMAGEPIRRLGEAVRTVTAELADAGPDRSSRHVWHRRGHAHIEVRGLAGRSGEDLADRVTAALRRLDGVQWTVVNAAIQQVLIAFDEKQTGLDTVLSTVEAVERERGADTEGFDPSSPSFPGDPSAEYSALVALAASLGGAALAAVGRAARLPGAPRVVRLPVAILEAQPRLRAIVTAHLGRLPADLLIGLANSAGYAATCDPFPLAVDSAQRALSLLEARACRLVWESRQDELCAAPPRSVAASPRPRPVPLPPGRIEKLAERSAVAALVAAGGLLAWHRAPGEAAA